MFFSAIRMGSLRGGPKKYGIQRSARKLIVRKKIQPKTAQKLEVRTGQKRNLWFCFFTSPEQYRVKLGWPLRGFWSRYLLSFRQQLRGVSPPTRPAKTWRVATHQQASRNSSEPKITLSHWTVWSCIWRVVFFHVTKKKRNFLKTTPRLSWDLAQTFLRLSWNVPEAVLRLSWNFPETFLRLSRNFPQTLFACSLARLLACSPSAGNGAWAFMIAPIINSVKKKTKVWGQCR